MSDTRFRHDRTRGVLTDRWSWRDTPAATGPHGTKSAVHTGDEPVPGYGSNFQDGRVSNNIYTGDSPAIPHSPMARHLLRVVGEVDNWQGHEPEVLKAMLDHLALLREQGLDVIED